MDATRQNGNEMSVNSTASKSSCKSFIDEGFPADDAMPPMPMPMRQRSCSRSYIGNRFSSYPTNATLMLAIYLLLPIGILMIAAEENQTSSILSNNKPEAYISASRHDDDNEIAITLNENPIKDDKDDYIPPSLAENLEDTIRTSVKNEIEKEQIAVSPALLNAYNVLPENEKILLVGYNGETTTELKNDLPLGQISESVSSTKCDASSLVCLRPNKEESPPSTPESINENIVPTTVATEQEISSSTQLFPTTVIPEMILQETSTQIVREGRNFESGNKLEQDSNSKVAENVQKNSPIESNSTIVLDELISELFREPLHEETNDIQTLHPIKTSAPIEQLLDTKETQAHVVDNKDELGTDLESDENPIVAFQTEGGTSLNIANETIVHFPNESAEPDTQVGVQASSIEPISEPRSNAKLDSETENEDLQETTKVGGPVDGTTVPTIVDGDINKLEPSNELTETATDIVDIESDIAQTIDANYNYQANSIANKTIQPETVENHLITDQSEENLNKTVSSNLPLEASENETLSITFEESLTATELPPVNDDEFVKTVINMEDPVFLQPDLTTVKPEHNVIKKQGVEPIGIEIPGKASEEEEVGSATLLPRINIPIGSTINEEDSVQPVKIDNSTQVLSNEREVILQPEGVVTPSSEENNHSTISPLETTAQEITELSVVFPGKVDDDASLSNKGSRSINALHSPLAGQHKTSINFDVYPAGQTFNENLSEELPNDIGKALPNQSFNFQVSNRSTIIIAVCSCTAFLFIVVSVTLFMASFQRQHGTLDIEMQERRDNVNDLEAETCLKLLDIELPSTSLSNQTDAEAEIEECL